MWNVSLHTLNLPHTHYAWTHCRRGVEFSLSPQTLCCSLLEVIEKKEKTHTMKIESSLQHIKLFPASSGSTNQVAGELEGLLSRTAIETTGLCLHKKLLSGGGEEGGSSRSHLTHWEKE